MLIVKIEEALKIRSEIPLSKSVIINLIYTSEITSSILSKVLKPYNISTQQYNVLRILRGQKNQPVNLNTVQERMISKMSNTTRLVDKLIDKKLVAKSINSKNRRKIDISITTEGLNFLSSVDHIIDAKEVEIASQITKDEALELIRLLGKLRIIAKHP